MMMTQDAPSNPLNIILYRQHFHPKKNLQFVIVLLRESSFINQKARADPEQMLKWENHSTYLIYIFQLSK